MRFLIDSIQEDLDKGAVVVIEDQRLRIRKLPFSNFIGGSDP